MNANVKQPLLPPLSPTEREEEKGKGKHTYRSITSINNSNSNSKSDLLHWLRCHLSLLRDALLMN